MLVPDALNLDMASLLEKLLDVDGAVAEGGDRLLLGGLDRGLKIFLRLDDPHPPLRHLQQQPSR